MSLFPKTYAGLVEQMGTDWVQAWDRIAFLIKRDASRVYKTPENATAYFHAMGTKGAATCTLSATFAAALNSTASIIGRQPIGDVVPAGYTLTADSAGNITAAYHDTDTSSSSTSSASDESSSSSSSGHNGV